MPTVRNYGRCSPFPFGYAKLAPRGPFCCSDLSFCSAERDGNIRNAKVHQVIAHIKHHSQTSEESSLGAEKSEELHTATQGESTPLLRGRAATLFVVRTVSLVSISLW